MAKLGKSSKTKKSASVKPSTAKPFIVTPQPTSLEDARKVIEDQAQVAERLSFLVEASKVLNSTLDLSELLDIILKLTSRQTKADRGSLFLVDEKSQEIWSLIAHGLGSEEEIRLPIGQGIVGTVARTGEVVNLEDAYEDQRFERDFDQETGYRTRSLLCVPIRNRDERIVGVLQLLNSEDGAFTAEDVEFLESISVHAALALDNARLHRESLERQRLERELSLARQIQESLLPPAPPSVPGYDIAVRYQSSYQVGGDYYDFIQIDGNSLVFVVADVEGKGVASALVMSNLQATLHALLKHVHSLQGVLFNLNEAMMRSSEARKYMTLFLGLLDIPNRAVHYINAGHVQPLLVRANGGLDVLADGGVPVGLFPKMRYQRGFTKLDAGDILLACSDGIPEAMNPAEEQYEDHRMVAAARARSVESAASIVDAIFADVDKFSEGGGLQDDRVLMTIKVEE